MEVSGGHDHVPRRHIDGVVLAYPAAAVDRRFAAVTGAQIGRAVVALTAGVARGVGCRAFATGRSRSCGGAGAGDVFGVVVAVAVVVGVVAELWR